jgi:hypothetical protein
MNTIFRWQIISEDVYTEYQGYNDYIYFLDWKYIGENGSYTSEIIGKTTFEIPSETFIPFADVTEANRISWIEQLTNVDLMKYQINIDLYNQEYTTTYRWYIRELETIPQYEGHTNFVAKVIYKYTATNNLGYNSSIEGQLTFNEVPSPYVPYDSITESDVILWLDTYTDRQKLRDNLVTNIMEQMNPYIVTLPLPWG